MDWLRNLTIGKRIALGFGVVLLTLAAVVVLSFVGIDGIVANAKEVIYGNRVKSEITQKEVDHLNWAAEVNKLLNSSDVRTLDVELDPEKCAFGKWLNSEERGKAENRIDGLAEVLDKIQKPHEKLHKSARAIEDAYKQANPQLPGILAEKKVDHLRWAAAIRDSLLENQAEVNVEVDPTECALGKWLSTQTAQKAYKNGDAAFRKAWNRVENVHKELHESAKAINRTYAQKHPGLRILLHKRLLDHKTWSEKVGNAVIEGDPDLKVETDETKCAYGQFLASDRYQQYTRNFPALAEALNKTKEPHKDLHASAVQISQALEKEKGGKTEAERIYQNETLPALEKIRDSFHTAMSEERTLVEAQEKATRIFQRKTLPLLDKTLGTLATLKKEAEHELEGMRKAESIYANRTQPQLQKVQHLLHNAENKVADNIMTDEAMLDSAQGTRRNVAAVGSIGIVAGVALAVLIAFAIVKALQNIISGLRSGAEEVTSASSQLSSSSQQLSENSSEQASSLEETSSSLEEMTSQTKQTAENADQAETAVKETEQVVQSGVESMERMSKTMEEIRNSSEETSKIIKTIDDIAFQTNLLALNAAVEAARAGEAGKGFAVVAEEVRNLAQRSSEAARNTSELIEKSQASSQNGAQVVEEVSTNLNSIKDSAGKVNTLVGEISAAAKEQSQGIDQINTAVAEMDKAVQQNASNSEETASAAEEMSSQAEQLNEMVGQLSLLVGSNGTQSADGGVRQGSSAQAQPVAAGPAQQPAQQQAAGGLQQAGSGHTEQRHLTGHVKSAHTRQGHKHSGQQDGSQNQAKRVGEPEHVTANG